MIVYVETNFVLQIALSQEEVASAADILLLAERGQIELAIPVFSLCEPFSTLSFREVERARLSDQLAAYATQLRRSLASSLSHRDAVSRVEVLPSVLIEVMREESSHLESIIERLLHTSQVLPLSSHVFEQARRYVLRYSLKIQDAIVYAAIISDLANRPVDDNKCFLSNDVRAFSYHTIRQELRRFNC